MLALVLAATLATADASAAVTAADAQPATTTAAPAAAKPKADDQGKIICRREVVGGTTFTERVCTLRTHDSGGAAASDAKHGADDRSGQTGGASGGGSGH